MLYKIRFKSEEKTYLIYAKSIDQTELFSFLVIEDLVFGEESDLIVNPQEEGLRNEFEGTNKIYIPIHNVILIEEVRHKGKAKILNTFNEVEKDGVGLPLASKKDEPGEVL